jgi:hypothetical protein
MTDRVFSIVVAVGLAVLVWLYARSRDQVTLDNVPIPVEITVTPSQADQYDLELNGPSHVSVSFRGPPSCIRTLRRMLENGELRVASVVVVPEERQNDSRFRETLRIEAADVPGPAGVTATVLEGRNRIPVTLYRVVERRLPVRIDPSPDERISQVVVEPARVRVRGPQEILDRMRAVPTQPFFVNVPSENETNCDTVVADAVALTQEIDGRPIRCVPASVKVKLTVRPRQKLYELSNVPVQFLCPAGFVLQPRFAGAQSQTIQLKLWGPVSEAQPQVTAYVDLTTRKWEPGQYEDEPLRLQFPNDFQLAQTPPRSAPFRLEVVSDARNGSDR